MTFEKMKLRTFLQKKSIWKARRVSYVLRRATGKANYIATVVWEDQEGLRKPWLPILLLSGQCVVNYTIQLQA